MWLPSDDSLCSPTPGGEYVYTDAVVVAGWTYYYKQEDAELDEHFPPAHHCDGVGGATIGGKPVTFRLRTCKGGAIMKRKRISILVIVALVISLDMLYMPKPAMATTIMSKQSGDWNSPDTWWGGAVPQAGDDVIIDAGHTVNVNVNTASVASITVNGTLRFDNSGTGKSMMVTGNVTVNNSGTLDVATGGSATTHSLTIGGDLTNNGTFDCLPAADRVINVTFNKDGNQTISGMGTTKSNVLTLNMGISSNNVLDVQAVISLAASSNPLVIQNGTFKLSSNSTITPFTSSAGATIPATGGFWVNGGTVNTGNLTWTLNGLLRVSAGTLNIGTASGNSVNYNSGSTITIEGGALNIAGRLSRRTTTQTTTYTKSGGAVTVVTVGSGDANLAGFDFGASGSSFTYEGGTVVIQKQTSGPSEYRNGASTNNVTGGTLQIGNTGTPTGQTMRINSTAPVFNLTINATNSPTAQLVTNGPTVKGDIDIQTGSTLDANNLDITLAGNWTNNSTFTAGTGAVTFNGTSTQTIGGSSTTAFNNLTINSGATVVVPDSDTPFTVAGTMTNNSRLRQTRTVNGANTVFLNISTNKYYGVEINPGSANMGATTVNIKGNQACNTTDTLVHRCFDIAPTTAQNATIKFRYLNSERNSNVPDSMKVFRWTYSNWSEENGTYSRGTSDSYEWVQVTDVDQYSAFGLDDGAPTGTPTAITLSSLTARSSPSRSAPLNWAAVIAFTLAGLVVAGVQYFLLYEDAPRWLRILAPSIFAISLILIGFMAGRG